MRKKRPKENVTDENILVTEPEKSVDIKKKKKKMDARLAYNRNNHFKGRRVYPDACLNDRIDAARELLKF